MQPAEALDFFSSQLARAEKGLVAAKLARNYQLIALNARQIFKHQLMLGLITWNQGEDSGELIALAVDSLRGNAIELSTLITDANVAIDLPLERAAILAFLIGKSNGVPVGALEVKSQDRRLDWMLVSALNSGQIPVDAALEIEELAKTSSLAAQSYRTYFEVISRFAEGVSADHLIKVAEESFRHRARDNFYSGGDQTEGGGLDNKVVVDYRLAAVLKKIAYPGPSVHLWRW